MIKTIILLTGLLTTISIQAVEFNYKTECIGSYTLQLPDNIEVALYPTETYDKPKSRYPIYFSDGKKAYQSIFNYNRNDLIITDTFVDKDKLDRLIRKEQEENNNIKVKYPNDSVNFSNHDDLLIFYANGASDITYIKYNRIYNFYTEKRYQGKEQDFEFYKQNAESIIAGFSTRELFDVPQLAGKCIPYGFVAGNDPNTSIDLGVSFRLNEHPDVVITFTENTNIITHAIKSTAKGEIENFWNYGYDYSNDNIAGIKLLGFPKYKTIQMDHRNGKSGFVEIIYKDGSPSDHGYYAVVNWSNPAKDVYKPWIQLSVIGKRSESKGKTPLTKDEIYQLAKTIEASIMRRETER